MSGLRRDIQDLVELYEYSSLYKVLHLAIKVETQLQKKKRPRGVVHTMTIILVLGKIKKENMINYHSRVPKTHLGLLMKLLILLKV